MLRASLDHHNPAIHEAERGARSWQPALDGLRWLSQSGFSIAVAVSLPNPITPPALAMPRSSRPKASRSTRTTRRAWSCFRRSTRLPTCRRDRRRAGNHDRMLGHPRQFARRHHVRDLPMVVHRRGENRARVVACTLIPYDAGFDLGSALAKGVNPVALNHPH